MKMKKKGRITDIFYCCLVAEMCLEPNYSAISWLSEFPCAKIKTFLSYSQHCSYLSLRPWLNALPVDVS